MTVGAGAHTYEVAEGWAQLPMGWAFTQTPAIVVDSQDRVYVFNRGVHPVIVFDRDGRFLKTWGEDLFTTAHGLWIDAHDHLYFVDMGSHILVKCTTDGKVLMTVGTTGVPHPDGSPFNIPTDVAVRPDGVFYVSDGYGNSRVHKFAPDGRLLQSWGEPGDGPGQFNLPHGITVDRLGRVYVADRENSRVQIFTAEGQFLTQWTDLFRPMQVYADGHDRIFVAEVGWRAGRFPWQTPPANPPGARVSVFDLEGRRLLQIGGDGDPCAPGNFFAPHDLCLDSRGDLYVGEVVLSAGGNRGLVPPSCHALQKLVLRQNA